MLRCSQGEILPSYTTVIEGQEKMTDTSVITREIKDLFGTEGKSDVIEVSREMIRKGAAAIGDDNPLWRDEEYARQVGRRGITVPPGLVFGARLSALENLPEVPTPHLKTALEGGADWKFFEDIHLGDVITTRCRFVDAHEHTGRSGKMLFLVFESELVNQFKIVVATVRATLIRF